MSVLNLICISAATYASILLIQFLKNLKVARETGLPYFCLPVAQEGLVWQLTDKWHRPIISHLPWRLSEWDWFRLWYPSWRFHAKYDLHRKYGEVFLVVTPFGITIEVANASVAMGVLGFDKPAWPYSLLNVYSQNIISANGSAWRRHHKAVYLGFHIGVYRTVWKNGLRYAQELLSSWTTNQSSQSMVDSIGPGIDHLALQVLLASGCGVTNVSSTEDRLIRPDHNSPIWDSQQLVSTLKFLVYNAALLVLPKQLLQWGPEKWKTVGRGRKSTEVFLDHILQQQNKLDSKTGNGEHNLLNDILHRARLPENGNAHGQEFSSEAMLSDQEILGNIFILFFAGTGTVSETLRYALVLLAMHPDIQDWLIADVQDTLKDQPSNPGEWHFDSLFPKFIAPLCVMLETLRHYSPTTSVIKWTGEEARQVSSGETSYVFPAQTTIHISLNALHMNPKYWGPAPENFRPQSWDSRGDCSWTMPGSNPNTSSPESPYVREPAKGTFLAFSHGARGCLGRRFAQIEFVAVILIIFRAYRVQLPVEGGKSWDERKAEAQAMLDQSLALPIMKIPVSIPLQFVRHG